MRKNIITICFGNGRQNTNCILNKIKLRNSSKEKILAIRIKNELRSFLSRTCKTAAKK